LDPGHCGTVQGIPARGFHSSLWSRVPCLAPSRCCTWVISILCLVVLNVYAMSTLSHSTSIINSEFPIFTRAAMARILTAQRGRAAWEVVESTIPSGGSESYQPFAMTTLKPAGSSSTWHGEPLPYCTSSAIMTPSILPIAPKDMRLIDDVRPSVRRLCPSPASISMSCSCAAVLICSQGAAALAALIPRSSSAVLVVLHANSTSDGYRSRQVQSTSALHYVAFTPIGSLIGVLGLLDLGNE
jgi:hypothetical protein